MAPCIKGLGLKDSKMVLVLRYMLIKVGIVLCLNVHVVKLHCDDSNVWL